jgi:hypothetical protein
MNNTQAIETLRERFDTRKQVWKIAKKTHSGSGGWKRFGGKEYPSAEECRNTIDRICDSYPYLYKKG